MCGKENEFSISNNFKLLWLTFPIKKFPLMIYLQLFPNTLNSKEPWWKTENDSSGNLEVFGRHVNIWVEIRSQINSIIILSNKSWVNISSKCFALPPCSSLFRDWRSATACINSTPGPITLRSTRQAPWTHRPPILPAAFCLSHRWTLLLPVLRTMGCSPTQQWQFSICRLLLPPNWLILHPLSSPQAQIYHRMVHLLTILPLCLGPQTFPTHQASWILQLLRTAPVSISQRCNPLQTINPWT